MLEVRHFRMVEAIAGTGSVTAAAKRLHLTQPAVSHALGDLEDRLGVTLFRREPRGMVLTREGERVRAAGVAVLQAVQEAEHDLKLYRQGCQGIVRVTTECYTCYHWLPRILQHFSTEFPDVEVQIVPDASNRPVDSLLDEGLDLAIMHSKVDHPALVAEDLFEDELVGIVSTQHPLAGKETLVPQDFEDEVLLLHSDWENALIVTEVLNRAGVTPARIVELRLTEAVLGATRAEFGITAMASWAVAPEVERGGLVAIPIGSEGLSRCWKLVTRKDLRHRASVQELARLLKEGAGTGAVLA